MGVEIERKFLVLLDAWVATGHVKLLRQGYLSRERGRSVRVRRAGEQAFLTIKGPSKGFIRPEFEYEIPVADADELLALCIQPLIEKRRHLVDHGGHTWEVDEFLGKNAGLWVAEIELENPDAEFARPPWLGVEVSSDPRYLNSNLVDHPFCDWNG